MELVAPLNLVRHLHMYTVWLRVCLSCFALLRTSLASKEEPRLRQLPSQRLGDIPVGGGKLQYLDSADASGSAGWHAQCVPSAPLVTNATCTFEPNVDFDVANTTPTSLKSTRTQQACCLECWNDPSCAAAAFVAGSGPNCYPKSVAQLQKKVTRAGRTACVRSRVVPGPAPAPPTCAGGRIDAQVPGDLLSDLQRAGRIGDPLYELNFKDKAQQAVWLQDWSYTRTFVLEGSAASALLVFDSIKMGARVYVDGTLLGTAQDQFLRYVFPLFGKLGPGPQHNLTVTFDHSIDTQGRFMACSGGWDWAPYTRVMATGGGSMMTKGIVRSVYIAYPPEQPAPPAVITAVGTEVLYKGVYPAAPLTDATKGDFEVRVRVHVNSHTAWYGGVQVTGSWSSSAVAFALLTPDASVPAGTSNFTVIVAAQSTDIALWWPVGLGDRPFYNISASLVSKGEAEDAMNATEVSGASTVRRIGFRTLAIVTGNDTDPAWVAANADADGSADPALGMLFRINGAAILARGGNLVPLDELEGRNTVASHRALVRSVAEGGMNILRIWGASWPGCR